MYNKKVDSTDSFQTVFEFSQPSMYINKVNSMLNQQTDYIRPEFKLALTVYIKWRVRKENKTAMFSNQIGYGYLVIKGSYMLASTTTTNYVIPALYSSSGVCTSSYSVIKWEKMNAG